MEQPTLEGLKGHNSLHVTDSISRSYTYIDRYNIYFRKTAVTFLTYSQSNNIIQHSVHFVNKRSSTSDL